MNSSFQNLEVDEIIKQAEQNMAYLTQFKLENQETQTHKKEVSDFENEIELLRRKSNELESLIKTTENLWREQHQRRQYLQRQLQISVSQEQIFKTELEEKLNKALQEIETKKSEILILKDLLSQEREQKLRKIQELKLITIEIQKVKKNNQQNHSSEINQLKQEINLFKKQLAESKQKLLTEQKMFQSTKQAMTSSFCTIENAHESQINSKNSEISTKSLLIEQLKSEIAANIKQIDSLKNNVLKNNQIVSKLTYQLKSLVEKNFNQDALQSQLISLQLKLSQNKEQIKQLLQQIQRKEAQKISIDRQLKQMKQNFLKFQKAVKILKEENANLKADLDNSKKIFQQEKESFKQIKIQLQQQTRIKEQATNKMKQRLISLEKQQIQSLAIKRQFNLLTGKFVEFNNEFQKVCLLKQKLEKSDKERRDQLRKQKVENDSIKSKYNKDLNYFKVQIEYRDQEISQLRSRLNLYENPKNNKERFQLIKKIFTSKNFQRSDKVSFMGWVEQFFSEYVSFLVQTGEQSVDLLNYGDI